MVRRRKTPHGAMYLNHGRWWLKVRPPQAEKPLYFPMVPDGQMYATRNKQVAEVLRKRKILELFSGGTPSQIEDLLLAFEQTEKLTSCPEHVRNKIRAVRIFFEMTGLRDPTQITAGVVEEYMTLLSEQEQCAPKTIANRRGHLGRFCQFLVIRGELASNPVRLTRSPKLAETEIKYLTQSEADRALQIAQKHGDDLYYPVAVALYAGLRLGEIMRLTWGDYRKTAKGPILVIGSNHPTKSGKPQSVPVSKKLQGIFAQMDKGKPGELIFRERSRRAWGLMLDPIKQELPAMARKGAGWHDFRRTFGSLLVQGGTRIEVVSKLLRHKNIAITVKHYAHLDAEMGRDALEIL